MINNMSWFREEGTIDLVGSDFGGRRYLVFGRGSDIEYSGII